MPSENGTLQTRGDEAVVEVHSSLGSYAIEHPRAEVSVFARQFGDEIGIRIIDPDFDGVSWKERSETIWRILDSSARELAARVSILVVMTPEEAHEAHITSVEFGENATGPVPFRDREVVFRAELDCHEVYVTVSQPFLDDLQRADGYCAAIKFDYPPGIIGADDDQLSVDFGETLRDGSYHVRWFDTIDQARDAAFMTARSRLARIAAA